MKTYKGFDKDLRCLDFQYEIGKEYETDEIKLCKKGFHSCEDFFKVLEFYPLVNNKCEENRFCEVEISGDLDKDSDKICTSKIKIVKEISDDDFFKMRGTHSTTNDLTRLIDNENYARIFLTNFRSEVISSGSYSTILSNKNTVQIISTGDYSQILSIGDYSQIVATSYCARIVSKGFKSCITSSASRLRLVLSGDNSQVEATGLYSQIASSGKDCIIVNIGVNGMVKAAEGSFITLAEYNKGYSYKLIGIKTEKVDGEKIKADTFYKLKNGKFIEVETEELKE